jgi:Uma2 family endonuclease
MVAITQETRPVNLTSPPQFPRQGEWTYQHWLNFPDDGWKYEIIDGVLYMAPAPAIDHQRSSGELFRRIANYAKEHDLGTVLQAPCDVRLPYQLVPLQPDIFFIRKERRGIISPQCVEGAPDLIVEILSPGYIDHDRRTKFNVYQKAGVPEYWLVDYQAKTVEIFTLVEAEYRLAGQYGRGDEAVSTQLAGFRVSVDSLFNF